ncbi:MAG: ParB N-terminal domain-containing protein [Rhodospirillaceae bacterium]|nr:ParB N-terminal domain-containing protein [Rhodospirillaceae bacterium]MDE0253711.1 ParB N-terminal domain-containing protein [Rhodospirillaceae bacterium]MDE0619146.1 ParB N-terminal domain-containing protein [Rhodospirillaceae bacterium]
MTDADFEIETIPIDRIAVLNPRVRDARKFAGIVDSIDRVGLKQPIKVSRIAGADGAPAYNLVYGQGRMEAFLALGQTEIPAIVTDLSEQDSLVESLVENIARRRPRPGDLFRAIGELGKRGYSNARIGAKIGYSQEHVRRIRSLLKAGEERLLIAVEQGKMPLRVAIAISDADNERAQEVLVEAYEKGELTLRQMPGARRALEHRQRYGKAQKPGKASRKPAAKSAQAVARDLKEAVKSHARLIESADRAAEQLDALVTGLRLLMSQDHFRAVLRAEGMRTMPAPLARLVEAPEEA